MANFKLTEIKGVISAMITTFDEHENVDLKRAETLTEYLISQGVNGLYLTGSTGEGFLMDAKERNSYVETVVKVARGRVPIIVHVGDIGTKLSIELAKAAENAGADAISSVPPFYWRFPADDIFGYYKDISTSVKIPMVVYNVPLAGMMSSSMIYRLAEIEGVQALKFTGQDHDNMCEIKQKLGKNFMVYSGCDEMATQGLLAGADGIIGSFYNLMPETFVKIYALCGEGKYAEAIEVQKIAAEFIHFAVQWDYYAVMRECLRWIGIDAGYSRKPFTAPSKENMQKLENFCRALKEKYGKTHMDFIDNKF